MFYPKLRSVAVVPVGLTRHRQDLVQLKGYNAVSARGIVQNVVNHQNRIQKKHREPWVYLADEFYLLAGHDIPPAEHYGDFWQVENGVGMVRSFLTEFEESSRRFPKQLNKVKNYTLVTGVLAGPILEKFVLPVLSRVKDMNVRLKVVPNTFYGETVTVSGLLTGGDIIQALQGHENDSTVLLPPNCLNDDGLFLDDRTLEDLSGVLGRHVRILNHFDELYNLEKEAKCPS
jgi:NifB/MoaA-like Fe-S oxidoreductase